MKIESKLVNVPYINKQKTYYFQYLKSGRRPAALDALWRAASNSNLLLDEEISHEKFTHERVAELLFKLDWEEMQSLKQLLLIAARELLSEGEYNCGICHTCGEIQECIEPDACEEQCECCKKFDVFGVSETLLMLAE